MPIYLHIVYDHFHRTVAELNSHNSEETGTLARGCARAPVRGTEAARFCDSFLGGDERGGREKLRSFPTSEEWGSESPVRPGGWVPSSRHLMSLPLGLGCGLGASARAKSRSHRSENGKLPSPQKNDSLIGTLERTPLYKTNRGCESPFPRDTLLAWLQKNSFPQPQEGTGLG